MLASMAQATLVSVVAKATHENRLTEIWLFA
jgi:hypothetical protein